MPAASTGRMQFKQSNPGFFPLNRRQKYVVLAMLLLLLLMSCAWLFAGESQVDRVRRMGGELFSKASKDMSPEERKEAWEKFKQENEKLSPEEKQQLRQEQEKRGLDWVKREAEKEVEKLDRFFKLPKEEQIAELNKDIDAQLERMEQFRNKAGEFRGKRGGFGGFFGGEGGGRGPRGRGGDNPGQPATPGGQPGTPGGQPVAPGGQQIAADGQPAAPKAGWGPKGKFGGKGNEAPQVRERRQKNYLDATGPEYRAQKSEYRRMRNEVLEQRGITLPTMGGRRGRTPI